ncbi:MAG TPA: 50S ribosomal protein L35 [Clostridia bacterium]|jgi:large subunit ribosomal protein L35|nr:50S ribosomal protein L35 [Clostridia bacterium]
MPKMKTHSGAKKRMRLTGNGLIKRSKQNKNHILTKKPTKRTRNLRQGGYVDKTQEKTMTTLLSGQK